MSDEKMRAALEAAREELIPLTMPNLANVVFTPDGKKHLEVTMKAIDDALKEPDAPEIDIEHEKNIAFQAGYEQYESFVKTIMPELGLKNKILQLPDQIREQSLKVAELSQQIEKLRTSIAHAKNQAFEIISGIKDGDKLKYSNEKARTVAQESLLANDKLYLDNVDELGRKEYQLRTEQIELEHLHNLFSAYKTVAGMQGVR